MNVPIRTHTDPHGQFMTRTITVEATGTCKTVPELASVDIDARDEGETAAAACAGARSRAEMIRTSIQAVPDDRIRTVDFALLKMEEGATIR